MTLPFKPARTFTGSTESVDAEGTATIDQINTDQDEQNKMFDPAATHGDGTAGGIAIGNLATGEAVSTKTANKLVLRDANGAAALDVNGNCSGSSGGILETGTGGVTIHKKVIEIGDWNMDTSATVEVSHGLTLSNIIAAQVAIRADSGSNLVMLAPQGLTIISCGETSVYIERTEGGVYDSASYASTGYNRGWIIIEYAD
jgi:hypothetical protein